MSFYDLRLMGMVLSLSGLMVIGMAGSAMCQATGESATPAQIVKGDVLDMEGEFYMVKDISGHEMRLHVNKDTKMEDRIKVGDKIEAQVTSEGHVKSIRIQIPDAPSSRPISPAMPRE
jgi:hypothetical protein